MSRLSRCQERNAILTTANKELNGRVDALESALLARDSVIASLRSDKTDLATRLEAANTTIADLEQQLAECREDEPQTPPAGKVLAHDACDTPTVEAISKWGAHDTEGSAGLTVATRDGRSVRRFRNSAGAVRNELGQNTRNPDMATFARFLHGDRRLIEIAFYLHDDYPLSSTRFQVLAQFKPSGLNASRMGVLGLNGSPPLSLRAMGGDVHLIYNHPYSHEPARKLIRAPLTSADIGKLITFRAEIGFDHGDGNKGDHDFDGYVNGSIMVGAGAEVTGQATGIGTLQNYTDDKPYPAQSHLRAGYYRDGSLGAGGIDLAEVKVSEA